MRFRSIALALFLLSTTSPDYAAACSGCGCSFNSEWPAQGYSADPGFHFDARYDYINQRELRTGSRAVSHSDFPLPNEEEIQQHTITRATTLGLDYIPTREWGFRAVVPFLDRTHTTVMPGDTESTRGDFLSLGDIQLIGRYQGFTPEANLGVQLGIKLPSGKFTENYDNPDEEMEDTPAALYPRHNGVDHGPDHPDGGRMDRGLQAGSGTTDLLFGLYKFGNLAERTEYFAQSFLVQPFDNRSGYRPGTAVTTSTGVSYLVADWVKPQLQLNYRVEAREEGENADHENSGGQFLSITPGFSFFPTDDLILYVLVEVPLAQDVNGLQLRPQGIYSAGVRTRF